MASALVGLLLLLLAPAPGERADDPGDASAEIAVVRAATQQMSGLSLSAPPCAYGEPSASHTFPQTEIDGPRTTVECVVPPAGHAFQPLTARAPPAA